MSSDVARAATILRSGGLVAFATETVYGLGARAFDPEAVARVFEVKERPHFDPLIVHMADQTWLDRLVLQVPDTARQLADRFWPGPLTLVLPKTSQVPDLVTAGLSTVAVRVPRHAQAIELLRAVDMPVAAPSANRFGQLSPTCAEDVAGQLGGRIDFILDGGPCSVGIESTVVQIVDGRPRLLRPGGVAAEDIESVIGPVELVETAQRPGAASPASPGMLPKHYAPRTPLQVATDLTGLPVGKRLGLLVLAATDDVSAFEAVEVLSDTADLTEAAANFFAALRRLDARKLDLIVGQPFPNHGLGRALNDRLLRAAHH